MYIKLVLKIVVSAISFGTICSCKPLSSMQTARTTDKGTFAYGGTYGVVASDEEVFPTVEGSVRYGFLDRWDAGFKIDIWGLMYLDTKLQIIGDRHSSFAASTGAGLGFCDFGIKEKTNIYHLAAPLYFSYHPSLWLGLYCNPRYVHEIMYLDNGDNPNTLKQGDYAGTSFGIRIGKRWALVTEYSFLLNLFEKEKFTQMSIGIVRGIN